MQFSADLNFTGKVVLITGASSGIGAGAARYFASLGAKLALTGRNADNLRKVATECVFAKSVGDWPAPLQIVIEDLNSAVDAKRIIDETIACFGRLDVLVNSAGILERGSIESGSLDVYDRTMDVNMRSVYQLTQLAVPHLVKVRGNVVNVSSVTGIRSFPGVLAYNVSKSALDQFTRCTALELADRGVRVNSINPGVIVTNIHKRGGMSEAEYAEFLERCKNTHALGRAGTVEDTAKAIAFLASDMASFITGVQLPVDGGRHAMCPR